MKFARLRLLFRTKRTEKNLLNFLSLIDERIATQNKIIEKLQSLIKGLVDELITKLLLKGKTLSVFFFLY